MDQWACACTDDAPTTAQATTAQTGNCPGDNCPSETTAPVGQLPQCDNCPSATTAPVRQLPQCYYCPSVTTEIWATLKISQVLPCSNFDCSPCVYLFLILHAKSLWPFDQFNYITCLPRLLDRFTVWQFLTFENGRFDQSVTNKKLKYPVLQVWRFVINKIWDSWSGGTPLKRKVFQDFFLRLGFGPNGPKPQPQKKILKNFSF